MPRRYVVTFEDVSVSAAQDLVQVKNAANNKVTVRVLRAWVGATDTALVTAQSIKTRCRILPATVTDGSAGSTPTAQKLDPGDAAATFSALANNTSKATTSGTALIVGERGDHIYSGAEHNFQSAPPIVAQGESFVFELLSTVSGTVHMSGGVEVEELGG
jgi:hypothetical protein